MTVAILEQNESHTELIPSLYYYLKEYNHQVFLIADEKAIAKMDSDLLNSFAGVKVLHKKKGLKNNLKSGAIINEYLKEKKIDTLLLNTASGKHLRNILWRISGKIQIFGIIHHTDKLYKSFTQRYITYRVNSFFKLASHLKSPTPLPVFFPLHTPIKLAESPETGPVRILIPGNIEQKRRDYQFLLAICQQYKEALKGKIRFIIGGNSKTTEGPEFVEKIHKNQLQGLFEWYEGFIPQKQFDELAATSHYVLPLLHPGIQDFNKYLDTKISGSFNLAFAFHKPLLLHSTFQGFYDFEEISFFYDSNSFIFTLLNLQHNPSDKLFALKQKYNFKKEARKFHTVLMENNKG